MKIIYENFQLKSEYRDLVDSIFHSLRSQFMDEKIEIRIKKEDERFHAWANIGGIYNINTDMRSFDLLVTIESLLIDIELKANKIIRDIYKSTENITLIA
ncbi:MAG: hypothetical protein H6622_01990 [Halobacteriovoraceae bacterium]|nr:hypothetical protein [Halobacteriovoraceae bacterium]